MKFSAKRRRRIRALIVGLAVVAIAVPVATVMPVEPGQSGTAVVSVKSGTSEIAAREAPVGPGGRLAPQGTRLASGEGAGVEWSSLSIGGAIALCVLLAAAVGLLVTRRRDPALGA